MRKACRTELHVFCSESLRAWGITDFPKSQFIPILWWGEKVCLCSKSRLLYCEKLNERRSKKKYHPAASFTHISFTLRLEWKRIPPKKLEQRIVYRLRPTTYVREQKEVAWANHQLHQQLEISDPLTFTWLILQPYHKPCDKMVNAENSHIHRLTIILL